MSWGLGGMQSIVSMKLFCFLDISRNGLSHISHLLLFFLRNSRCKALSDGSF